jgi:hypothetical protein
MRKNQSVQRAHYFHARVMVYLIASMAAACSQSVSQQPAKPVSATAPAAATSPSLMTQAKSPPASTQQPQRILARLNGLSGESDPRLDKLKQLITTSKGLSLLSLGILPAAQNTATPNTANSAVLVIGVDTQLITMAVALSLVNGFENFAYVEPDQPLQKR